MPVVTTDILNPRQKVIQELEEKVQGVGSSQGCCPPSPHPDTHADTGVRALRGCKIRAVGPGWASGGQHGPTRPGRCSTRHRGGLEWSGHWTTQTGESPRSVPPYLGHRFRGSSHSVNPPGYSGGGGRSRERRGLRWRREARGQSRPGAAGYLRVDLFVDGALCLLLLLHGQQVHQGPDGHALGNGEGELDLVGVGWVQHS